MSHDDFTFESSRGLPGPLPQGERMLWQGAPDWRALALHAYRVRALATYGATIILARALYRLLGGAAIPEIVGDLWVPVALMATGLALLCVIAWLAARTTVYTLTDRRVVIRQGIALPVTMNLPLSLVNAVAGAQRAGDTGDLALQLAPDQRVSYLLLWPHVRPWHWRHPQPMLRAIPRHDAVGAQLVAAMQGKARTRQVAPAAADTDVGSLSLA